MKLHTTAFKEQIKEMGRELDSIITFGDTVLGSEQLNAVTPSFQSSILKSAMKQLDIDSNVPIPIGTILNYKFGVKINEEYEYIDFGNYIVKEIEKQEDTMSYKITCYDKMLLTMKDYVEVPITYPITIRNYINSLCIFLGLSFANKNDEFANYDKEIPNELYLDRNGKSLGYTFRDVFDELAQVTASTICINNNDEVEVRYIADTEDTIDEEYLKNINVNFGEKYGKVNSIVLSRSGESDNIYLRDETSVEENGLTELKIVDNQIMNFNNRVDYLPDILEKLNGLEYYINDFSSTGITYYDICDRYNVKIGENTYSCVMFNDEILITQGLEENIYTEIPEETETDYKKASKTDRLINQTNLIVDKQLGEIRGIVEEVETTVENITTTTQTSKGGNHLYLEDAMESNALEYIVEGKSEQETRSGKNLIPVTLEQHSYNGMTYTKNKDGSVTLNGTATAKVAFVLHQEDISLNKGTYTMSILDNAITGLTIGTQIDNSYYANETSKQIVLNNDATFKKWYIDIASGTTLDNVIVYPMFELGNSKTEYEQYGASPSPDYPSEIKTVKGIRNLFKTTDNPYKNLVTYNKITDNSFSISINRTSTTNWSGYVEIPIDISTVKPNTTYTFSKKHKINGTTFNRMGAIRTKINGTYNTLYETDSITFTTPEDLQSLSLVFYIAHTDTTIGTGSIDFEDIMLEEGSVRHSFVPYGSWLEVKNTGKNLLPNNIDTQTINGVEIIKRADGSIVLNGTSTTATRLYFYDKHIKLGAGTYTFSSHKSGTVDASTYMSLVKPDGTDIGSVALNALGYRTHTFDEDTYLLVSLYFGANRTFTDFIIYPMTEKGSNVTEYEPYKEQSTLIDMNKPNLADKEKIIIGYNLDSSNGETYADTTRNTMDYIEIKPNTTYTIKNCVVKAEVFYNENKAVISSKSGLETITTPSTAKYLRFGFDSTQDYTNIKLYEGYDDYYELPSINDTKDILTIQNKQATINQRIGKVVLNGSQTIAKGGTIPRFYVSVPNLKASTSNQYIPNILCDILSAGSMDDTARNVNCISSSTEATPRLVIYLDICAEMTLTEFKTWLSENPVTVYYELEEPQTIELGDFPIMLYNNINNVTLMSDLETTTQITYLRNTPLSNDYATNQRVDKTDSDLETTNNSLNQTKQDVENTALDLHNNYYDKEQIDSIITTTEEEITTLKQTVETNTSSTNLQISVIEEQLKNGVTAVKTETGYTFDKNGLNISKTGSEMSSTLDNDGLSVKRDNTEVLTVRSAGVETENLKVRTYFTIGSHTRVEDYGNGTGFFHIGGV